MLIVLITLLSITISTLNYKAIAQIEPLDRPFRQPGAQWRVAGQLSILEAVSWTSQPQ